MLKLDRLFFRGGEMTAKFTFDESFVMNVIDTSLGLSDELVPLKNQSLTMSRFDMSMPFDSGFNNSTDLRMQIRPIPKTAPAKISCL